VNQFLPIGADAQRLPIIVRSTTLCKERRQLQGMKSRVRAFWKLQTYAQSRGMTK